MITARFLSSLLLLTGAAACAPISLATFGPAGGGSSGSSVVATGAGGYGAGDDTASGSTGSGSVGTGGGGGTSMVMVPLPPINGSFSYLCGDTSSACFPQTDQCAPGGNPNPNGGSPDGSSLTCQLVSDGAEATGQCGMSGYGTDDSPCAGVGDCQANFGCVVSAYPGVGACREYCCQDLESCPDGQYCSPTPINGIDEPVIPVCIPATMCHLLEDAKYCPPGTTCAVVRQQGTTSCVVPGTGVQGDSCTNGAGPCAAGYACSTATGTCLELCHTNGGTECGPGGTCEGGVAPYPDGIGICVFN